MSLVISQTQEVHEEIVDLLEQLRRMQDLQVTIEVRFITLNDNFFERIGVDFDFTIAKNIANPQANGFSAPQAITVGGQNFTAPSYNPNGNNGVALSGIQGGSNNPAQNGIFTADNSINFSQGSYALGVPQFGGFDAAAGATVGFAILSDIEAFFFINAAAGRPPHQRAAGPQGHALQRPAGVRLRHVADAVRDQRDPGGGRLRRGPAAGDRRALRRHVPDRAGRGLQRSPLRAIDVVPFFSKIGNVQDVHLPGHRYDDDQHDAATASSTDGARTCSTPTTTSRPRRTHGMTVQLPTFSFVTVTTTVSVPDGGTVLLGGIKRLSEGRNEFGVPILEQAALHQPSVQERRHRPRDRKA